MARVLNIIQLVLQVSGQQITTHCYPVVSKLFGLVRLFFVSM